MSNTKRINAQERIIYVEPNDATGHLNQIPITPDYTDFCISFDLIVDVVSRMRANSVTISQPTRVKTDDGDEKQEMRTYVISWTSKYDPENKNPNTNPNYVSFMGGVRYGSRDYLTTFYTDTHYNDFKNKTIVEGLGVESVSITFESYYTPTVKIRFIDVRGASIFGREEVLHTDEILSEDNIWGCFFTFPYPKYRLQVKGFYGKAVTYQLCCTDFRANFNSTTGNYEIDMTFLGYDFGLLADIPMQYLIAAPHCHYADTIAYWTNKRSSDPYWRMSDGREPETFHDISLEIGKIIGNFTDGQSDKVVEQEYEETIIDVERQEVMDEMSTYVTAISHYYERNFGLGTSNNNSGIGLQPINNTTPSFGIGTTNTTINFNVETPVIISGGEIYGGTEAFRNELKGKNVDLDKIAKDNAEKLNELWEKYKERWPDKELSKVDIQLLNEDNIRERFHFFAEAYHRDYETLKQVQTGTRTITPYRNIGGRKIQDLVLFLPNIGNVFKTLYCHLETFVHMIYVCARNIYAQKQAKERDYQKLGIQSIDLTDVNPKNLSDDQMDPFPAIYLLKNSNDDNKDAEQDDVDDVVQVDAWPGELHRNNPNAAVWEEEVLVNELFKAVLRVKTDTYENSTNFSPTNFPVLPSDLNHSTISGIGASTEGGAPNLAGYLAIRAASLFGISEFTKDEAEEVGRADAFNYFESNGSKTTIKTQILDTLGNGNKADALYDLMLCQGQVASQNQMPFEVGKNLIGVKGAKHPFFVINSSNNLQWSYAQDNKSNVFVPCRLGSWGDMNSNVLDYHGEPIDSYYTFKTTENKTSRILYKCFTDPALSEEAAFTDEDKLLYTNDEMFTVYYGEGYGNGADVAEKVTELYNNLKDGAVNLNGFTAESDPNRFKKILTNHWINIDQNTFTNRYHAKLQSLYPSFKILGIDKTNVGIQSDGNIKFGDGNIFYKINKKNITQKNGVYKYGDETINLDECYCTIPTIRFFNGETIKTVNVFTSSFYYLQNKRDISQKDYKYSSKNFAPEAVKALLFLLTLDHVDDFTQGYIKNIYSGRIEGVPLSIILFHGALLWRKEFYDQNGFDPINTTGFKSFDIKKDEIPIIDYGNNTYNRGIILQGGYSGYKYITYSELFCTTKGSKDKNKCGVDILLKNKLINMFRYFVNNEWKTIEENCELKKQDGSLVSYKDIEELAQPGSVTASEYNNMLRQNFGRSYFGKYFYINNFSGKEYVKGLGLASILAEENPAIPTIKEIYLSKIIVQKTASNQSYVRGNFSIEQSVMKSYLNGFVRQIEEICNSETVNTLSTSSDVEEQEGDRDIKRLIYMFLKNMWDRWFVGNSEDMFTVKNYMANTIFIDSMYRNVYTHIHINCEILYDLLTESDGKAMVFKFLSDITTKHHCMFFALPDYLNLGEPDNKTAEENMLALFNPLPYTKIDKVRSFNRYIVMFTHKPSEINETSNSYKYDSFDIYSHDDDKKLILPTFDKPAISNMSAKDYEMQCTRYGYNVPAFGVEFGRQNNAIFRKINVGMQNPIQTEQAINALSLIASRGRGGGERTIFYGQDLYSVYSGYSYTATIEMMGNAQIMPLMYFQLFNVPMFRGAYMIYGVQHTMRPGDMTTTVKAMKMSKHTLPWCQEWYAHYYFDSEGNIITDYDDICDIITGTGGGKLGSEQTLTSGEIKNAHNQKKLCDAVGKSRYHKRTPEMKKEIESNIVKIRLRLRSTENKDIYKWAIIHKVLANDIVAIFNEIYNTTDYKFNPAQFYEYPQHKEKPISEIPVFGETGKTDGTTVLGSYEYRDTSGGSVSNHAFAAAVDLNPGYNPMLKQLDNHVDDDKHIRTKKHPVVQIFAKHGWGWGGSYGDMMHFSPFYGS